MVEQFWNTNSEWWLNTVRSESIDSRKITSPAIVSAIANLKPSSVLDLGCGEGWLSAHIPVGTKYVGIDTSAELVEKAALQYQDRPFFTCTYEQLIAGKWRSKESFDLVVFNFSLFQRELHQVLAFSKSLLNANGTILIQTLHPNYTLVPYLDDWRSENFSSFVTKPNGEMNWYGRTLSSWCKEISLANLFIREIIEPTDPKINLPVSLIFVLGSKI